MPHTRSRFVIAHLRKIAKFWPAVGVLGPRQSGKTTLVNQLLGIPHTLTLDDLETREEASNSPKTLLARYETPLVIDEVQKAPEIFDAIKLRIDRKKIPGSYYLTGSSAFSAKLGIRESLTGRIGLTHLYPMTLGELHQKEFNPLKSLSSFEPKRPRFTIDTFTQAAWAGGMPVPAFLRQTEQRDLYWRSWLETTIYRDLARFFKRNYEPDLALSLLTKMASIMREGELPTLRHFKQPARQVRAYFLAMQEIFLLRKVSCHPEGIGKEVWILMDSGLAAYLMGNAPGESALLSIARHFLWNEWGTQREYQGKPFERVYYKTAQGSPVDAIFDGIPFRIVASATSVTRQLKWEERPLIGAMKKIGSKAGYLVAPVDSVHLPGKKGGIGILPWSTWS